MATEEDWEEFFGEMREYVKGKFEEKGKTAPAPGAKDEKSGTPPTPPEPPKEEKAKRKRWGFFPEEN